MPYLRFQVEGHTALIAVDGYEVEAHTSFKLWRHEASIVAGTWFLDFDDICAVVC